MAVPAETFHAVGGFDVELGRVYYEDNDLAYRLFRHFGRRSGHFRYDPSLVCYHLPHLREGSAEWAHTTDVVAYLKDKYRHFELELLSNPPNHLRVAQTLPYYESAIAHVRNVSSPDVAARVARAVGPARGEELWIGCGVTAAGRGSLCLRAAGRVRRDLVDVELEILLDDIAGGFAREAFVGQPDEIGIVDVRMTPGTSTRPVGSSIRRVVQHISRNRAAAGLW